MIYASRFLRKTEPNMTGPDVLWVKLILGSRGLLNDTSCPEFDEETEAAVIDFQERHGLLADGIVGPSTYTHLWAHALTMLTGCHKPAAPGPERQHLKKGSQRHPSKLLHIDGGRCLLHVLENGHVQESHPIAVGAPDTPTPIGYWQIISRDVQSQGLFGTRWLGLNIPFGCYGIHGTDRPASLGKRVTHGCIYMVNSGLEKLFPRIPIGTPVVISGKAINGRLLQPSTLPGLDIQYVQEKLQKLAIYRGDAHGRYTPATAAAVASFQERAGLNVTGIVGPETYEALQKIYDEARGHIYP